MWNRLTARSFLAGALLIANGGMLHAAARGTAPRDMKLLVVAVDGNEPDYAALKFFIETLGIPYQTAFTLNTRTTPAVSIPLPALTDGVKGLYQGIILTNGSTAYCYPWPSTLGCTTGLTADGWTALENYARDFGVRIASYYSYPEARYGLADAGGAISATTAAPVSATFTGPAAGLFPYLNTMTPLKITNAYVYRAQAAPAAGETTTPFLMAGSAVLGALHTKADGREYMALTVDNNPNLQHSLILNYGILNWVTKGVFIGGRKVYLTPQVDDHFLSNDLFFIGNSACRPAGFVNDPTYDPAGACATLRINGLELKSLADWQAKWNTAPQFQRFRVTHAFNGAGSVDENGVTLTDDLVQQTIALRGKFYWINHSWDHDDLDCFNATPNSGAVTCRSVTKAEALDEIAKNVNQAKALGLPLDSLSMVTPGISGLKNPAFLAAAAQKGIRYLVSDTSKPEYLPAIPNTGVPNPIQPSILMIPRRPANIFYNTSTRAIGVPGSLADEYNYFFGPNGLFRIGGTNEPFFKTVQNYSDILNTESDNLLTYMLRAEVYPQMYHQSNLHLYDGKRSLFSDVHDAAMGKYAAISKLPVISLTQSDLGRELEAKMAVMNSQVTGVWTPGKGVSLTGRAAANVPVTGVCFGSTCESYGGQCVSKVPLKGAGSVSLDASALTAACSVNPGLPDVPAPPAPAIPPSKPNAQLQNAAAAQELLTKLTSLAAVDAKRIQDAMDVITDSIDPSFWLTGDRLNPDEGKAVFTAHQKAAQQLMAAIKDKRLDVNEFVVTAVLRALVEIDRTLADLSLQQARLVAAGSRDLNSALQNIAKAQAATAAGKYDDAIGGYAQAWEAAEQAINKTE